MTSLEPRSPATETTTHRRAFGPPEFRLQWIGALCILQGLGPPPCLRSAASSSPEDKTRGIEFLYSPNRLNVATSRAKCAAFMVASPLLFEPDCKTPRQMKLANAFCRYRELATDFGSRGDVRRLEF